MKLHHIGFAGVVIAASVAAIVIADSRDLPQAAPAKTFERRPRQPLPERPAVAILDFTAVENSYSANQIAASVSSAVGAMVADVESVRWIERQQLAAAAQELQFVSFSPSGFAGASTMRLGNWVKADLTVNGTFAPDGKGGLNLHLEVIDLSTADVLAETTVDMKGVRLADEKIGGARVARAAEVVRRLLADALARRRAGEGARRIAPLFFRNVGQVDRLDFIERDLLNDVAAAAAQDNRNLRALRFPRSASASSEQDLALLGLTDANVDAWQGLADVYVWGSFKERDPAVASAAAADTRQPRAFDDVEVELSISAWDGFNPVQSFTETTRVADLAAARKRLVGRIVELAQKEPPKQLSAEARDAVVKSLRDRAHETSRGMQTNWTWFKNAPAHERVRHGYATSLLQVAAFLAPDDANVRLDLLTRQHFSLFPDGPEGFSRTLARVEAEGAFVRTFGPTTKDRKGLPDAEPAQRLVEAFEQAFYILRYPKGKGVPDDLPNAAMGRLRDDLARQSVALARLIRPLADAAVPRRPGAKTPYDTMGPKIVHGVLEASGDPKVTVETIEAWWPMTRRAYAESKRPGVGYMMRDIEQRLAKAYDEAGRRGDLAALLASESGDAPAKSPPPSPERPVAQAPPPPPRSQAIAQRPSSRPTTAQRALMRGAAPSFDDLPPQPPRPPGELAVLRPPLYPIDPWRLNAIEELRIVDRNDHAVGATAYAGGRVWVAGLSNPHARGTGAPKLLFYEAATDEPVDVSDRVAAGAVVNDLCAGPRELWVATDGAGLLQVDPVSLAVRRYGGEQGLRSTKVQRVLLIGETVYAIAGGALNALDRKTGRFAELRVPASRTGGAVDFASAVAHRDGIIFPGPEPFLFHPAGATRVEIGDVTGISTCAADDNAFWFGGNNELVRYDVRAKTTERVRLPVTAEYTIAADGDVLWAAYVRRRLVTDRVTRFALPETWVLMWHAPARRWVGCIRIEGAIARLCVGPDALWVTLNEASRSLVRIDRDACYAAAGAKGTDLSDRLVPADDTRVSEGTGATPLMRAAYDGRLDVVNRLLDGGARVNDATPSGWTALLSAAAGGRADVVRALLDRGANVDAQRRSPAVGVASVAAQSGKVDVLRFLLDRGAGTANVADTGFDPMWMAVASGQIDVVRLLIERGVAPAMFIRNDPRPTPLSIAVARGHRDIAKLLAERGFGADDRMTHALTLAVSRGETEILDDLLAAGGDPLGGSPSAMVTAILRKDAEVVGRFLGAGAKPAHPGLLIAACLTGDAQIVRMLIQAGADVNGVDEHRVFAGNDPTPRRSCDTPYVVAARAGRRELLGVLDAAGANLAMDIFGIRQGDLALIAAATARDFQTVDRLIRAGYDVNARDHQGRTAMMIAEEQRASAIVTELMARGAKPSLKEPTAAGKTAVPQSAFLAAESLVVAAEKGDLEAVRRLVKSGARVDAKDRDGSSALVAAAYRGHTAVVQALLVAQADPNQQAEGGWTALMHASRAGNAELVRALLDARAHPQVVNAAGRTARDLAEKAGRAEVVALLDAEGAANLDGRALIDAVRQSDVQAVRKLLDAGANINAVDGRGRSALFYALDGENPPGFDGSRFSRDVDVIRTLLKRNADVNHADAGGRTPLMALLTSKEGPEAELVRLLVEKGAKPNARDKSGRTAIDAARDIRDATIRNAVIEALNGPAAAK